jgi:hypothetical protein
MIYKVSRMARGRLLLALVQAMRPVLHIKIKIPVYTHMQGTFRVNLNRYVETR